MNEVAALKGLIRARQKRIRELQPQLVELRIKRDALKIAVTEARLNEEAARRVLQMVINQQAITEMETVEVLT